MLQSACRAVVRAFSSSSPAAATACLDCTASVTPYTRHVLVTTDAVASTWPGKVELLPHVAAVKAVLGQLPGIRITLVRRFGGPQNSDDCNTLIVYPGRHIIRLNEMSTEQLLQAVQDVKEAEQTSSVGPAHDILVCVHGNKDKRCGDAGPAVLQRLHERIASAEGGSDVILWESSHIGGHKYAGNVIVYPDGLWYGNVRSSDNVDLIYELHQEQKGDLNQLARFYRGRMGLDREAQREEHEQRYLGRAAPKVSYE